MPAVWTSPFIKEQWKLKSALECMTEASKWMLIDSFCIIVIILELKFKFSKYILPYCVVYSPIFIIAVFLTFFCFGITWLYQVVRLIGLMYTYSHYFGIGGYRKEKVCVPTLDTSPMRDKTYSTFASKFCGPSMFGKATQQLRTDNSSRNFCESSGYGINKSVHFYLSSLSLEKSENSPWLSNNDNYQNQSFSQNHKTPEKVVYSPCAYFQNNFSLIGAALSPIFGQTGHAALSSLGGQSEALRFATISNNEININNANCIGKPPSPSIGAIRRNITTNDLVMYQHQFAQSAQQQPQITLQRYQYQLASSPPTSPNATGASNSCVSRANNSDSLIVGAGGDLSVSPQLLHSPSNAIWRNSRFGVPNAGGTSGQQILGIELLADQYWKENKVTEDDLEKWTLDLKKWLHGTIIRRLVLEINAVNARLVETSSEVTIGATTLTTLQQLTISKFQCLPTLPTLISFLDCTKDQGYLVNRLVELSRGGCLEEYQWDGGSRNPVWLWREHLPNDSLILLHLFSSYMDTRLPPHPKCLSGRPFSELCVVRHPDKPDLKSKYNCQLYQVGVQPPSLKVVLDNNIYNFQPGRKNLFHAIILFFHYYANLDGKLRMISLGSSGLNISWIFQKK